MQGNAITFHKGIRYNLIRHISEDAAKTSDCSIVNGRLDYCNSLLNRTSLSNINKLQWVQNSVARTITRRRLSYHITPVLPDQYRIQHKLAVITFKVLTTQQSSFLHDLIRSHASTRQLRSDSQGLLQVD